MYSWAVRSTIYVSKENLYAAVTDYSYDYTIRQSEEFSPEYSTSTVIYKFELNGGKIGKAVQGEVPGTIINQFSMDEHANIFRIATTTGDMWRNNSKNNVYILDENLKPLGKLEGLAEGKEFTAPGLQETGSTWLPSGRLTPCL